MAAHHTGTMCEAGRIPKNTFRFTFYYIWRPKEKCRLSVSRFRQQRDLKELRCPQDVDRVTDLGWKSCEGLLVPAQYRPLTQAANQSVLSNKQTLLGQFCRIRAVSVAA